MRNILLSAAAAAIALTSTSTIHAVAQEASAQESLPLEGIAVIVNDHPISFTDVRQRARMMLLSLGGQDPTPQQVQQVTSQALEALVEERLQLQKAGEFEVEISDADIASSIEDMAVQSGTTGDILKQTLLSRGVNPTSLEEQMRAEISWSRIMQGLYGTRIRISQNQVDDQITRLKSASQKTRFQLSEIFLYAPDAQSKAEATAAARTILEQLEQGADFRVAAQRLSSAPTAATGGDMGWLTVDDLDPILGAEVAKKTEPGMTEPIVVDNGVYLLAVRNRQEPSESVTKVDLIRLVTQGAESELTDAMAEIESCSDVKAVAGSNENLSAGQLDGINVEDLGPEGKSLILNAEIDGPTEIFAASGGIAVMYLCSREDGADAIPSREEIKSRLKSRQLGMIAERELRDLRREATIIDRTKG